MWQTLFMALGLVFIIEGLTPFLGPNFWRQIMQNMLVQSNKTIRIFGLASMLIGLGLLYWVR